jgi:riboflavin biosynthesis pyrimidine reductase
MLPRVILHNAVSVDGRIDWFTPDIGQFYELASRWSEDATLTGSDTLLSAGLVDDVSVLINHGLAGGTTPRSPFHAPDLTSSDGVAHFRLTRVERLDNDVVWLRYDVIK